MEEKKGVDPSLKSEYMSLEIRDYLVANKINEKCNENASLILYFVSSANCPSCKDQGNQLTLARESTGARVYTFDMDVNNSMVSALAGMFSISTYPSIVIDSTTYSGYMTADKILSEIKS
jgi:glutaredoxin-related protein